MKSGLKILKSRWDFSNKKGIMSHFDMRKKRNKFLYLAMIFALFVAVFVCIFPLLWMFFTAFKESIYEPGFFPKALEFKKLADAWKLLKFNKYFLNTVTIVALSLFASLICNGLGAFSLAIIKPKGHKIIFFLILITLMVPAVTLEQRTLSGLQKVFAKAKGQGLCRNFKLAPRARRKVVGRCL